MRRLISAAALVVAAMSFSGNANAESKILTITVPAMPTGYPVVAAAGLADILATNLFAEGLTRWSRDTLSVEPALAVAWQPNADGTVWTFTLRDGVTWHDGKPFTAEDVKYTLDLIVDKNVRAAAAGQVAGLKGVEILAPNKVQLTFANPTSALLEMLAYRMPIVPKHALEGQDPNQPSAFIRKPIGTGPFMFANSASGQSWSVVRNPNWWGGKVGLDEVVLRVMPDANSTVAQLKTGNTDVALIQPQQVPALKGSKVAVSSVDQPSFYYVTLLNNKPPFDDVKVRQAFNYAVDKAGVIKAVVDGYASAATGVIAPSVEAYTSDVATYPYDPARAKALLKESGWTLDNGKLTKDGKPLKVELTTSTGVLGGPQLAQIIQQQLSDLGIDASINLVDFRELWVGVFAGRYQASVEYLNLQPSPDVTNALACGGSQNRFAFCDKRVDALLAQAAASTDPAQRKSKYAELQKLVADNPPGIFLYYPQEIRAVSDRVVNFPRNPIRMATTHLFDVVVKD
jgi:peptide/nickel transport system substrate-binding protein